MKNWITAVLVSSDETDAMFTNVCKLLSAAGRGTALVPE